MKYCLGTVQFGMNYGIQGNGRPESEKTAQMLSYAIENGISYFDTASAYGEAEQVLGKYIRDYPEAGGRMRIVSKLRPDAFQNQPMGKWKKIVVQNAETSLDKLGITKFAAYLFHNASHILTPYAIEALDIVVQRGLADKIGVSIYTPEEAMKALEYPQIGVIQVPYNVFDRRLDRCDFFKKAKAAGVTVFARSSLLQGLVMMNPERLPGRVRFARDYLVKFLDICRDFNVSALHAAIGYVAGKEIDYIVFGADNPSQLEEYLSMEHQKLPVEMVSRFDSAFNRVEEKLVNPVLWNE